MSQVTSLIRNEVSPEEWSARIDLAAAYRLVAHYGWDDIVATHISARVPGPERHFLINPFGMMFEEVTASNLVKVNLEGEIVQSTSHQINKAGFIIHSAIHEAREDAHCVMHLHTIDGVAVSSQEDGLLPLNQQAMLLNGNLSYHEFEGMALSEDERPRLARDLGDARAMILRNHGTLTVGATVAEAFAVMYWLERSCSTQLAAQSGGARLRIPERPIQSLMQEQSDWVIKQASNELLWPALLRMLDRKYPDFRN